MRGRKPTLSKLRLIEGTRHVTRHGSEEDLREKANETSHYGPLERPKFLRGRARSAWELFIAPAYWLDGSRLGAAIRLCQLWQECQQSPLRFQASKEAQLRGYFADLGLTDERNRKIKADEAGQDELFPD